MQKNVIEFDDYVGIVRERAHYYTKCYRMDYEEVEAHGFWIYCKALENYKKNKNASFSTFLYINLSGRLRDYCRSLNHKTRLDESLEDSITDECTISYKDSLQDRRINYTKEELMLFAKSVLSADAYKILCWVLDRSWENEDVTQKKIHASLQYAFCDVKKWSLDRVYKSWIELKDCWNSGLFLRGIA